VGRYRTIVADPPWEYDGGFYTTSHDPRTGRLSNPKRVALAYDALSVDEIKALPVGELALPDAFLFLWTTNRYLPAAFDLLPAWGFRYAQMLVWAKDRSNGLPAAIAPVHAEFLLMAKRGQPTRRATFPSSVIEANRTKQHSAKPECFLDHVEAACPGPYVELFARRARFGWDYWGDESLGTAELVA
jgi:N6-adenosine-specific RNA methylase IME4